MKTMKKIFFLVFIGILFFLFLNLISASNVSLIRNETWQNNLTATRYGSTSLGDIDNDGDLDLALSGCLSDGSNRCEDGTITKIYINNGTTLTENSTWQQNLTGAGWSSTAFGDIDNDGDLDLALSGCTNASDDGVSCYGNIITKIYINNGTSLIESSQWQSNLTGTFDGHIAFADMNNNGKLDLLQIGRTTTDSKIAKVYINNGTTLNEDSQLEQNLTGLDDSSLAFGDVDNDGYLDLALTGEDSSSLKKTKIYINNGTSLIESSQWQNNLLQLTESSSIFGDIDNDGDLDYIIMGGFDYLYVYKNNGSSLIIKQRDVVRGDTDLIGIFAGSLAFGDYDNDGYLDFVGVGRESGYNRIYWNNITKENNFSVDNIAGQDIQSDDLYLGSFTFGDLDNDNDLDGISTGANISWGLLSRVYISNASLTKNNSQPTPPNTFTSSYSNGVLNLTWNNGSDAETNSTGLYYNLMVGNSTTNNTVVSGVYGGSSGGGDGGGPSSGYFGNMMQRKNISLNIYLPEGVYNWTVQTIDTGLAKSNWSEMQSFTVGGDITPPTLSSVSSSVTSSSTATITWTTNESANSSVYYGTTTSTTSFSGSTGLTTSHSISLSSLSASTLYYYNVSSCDYWKNCNISIQYNFTTSASGGGGNGGGGGGGGGGSSGGSSGGGTITATTPTQPKAFDVDFSAETTGTLETKAGDVKTFSFQGEVKHSITILAVSDNSITLLITSDPITMQINVGETKQIDINKDNINDLEIKLNSIANGKAKFSMTKLSGADVVAKEELGKGALFDVKVSLSNLFNAVKTGREVIAKVEVLNVNNIGQVDVVVDYYITTKEDNKTKLAEGSDTLAVEAVASFVRSLTVPYNLKAGRYLFNVDVKYKDKLMASGNAEFIVIKTYEIIIAVGVVVLIIAGIFIYLWRIKRKEEKDIGVLKREIRTLKKESLRKRWKKWRNKARGRRKRWR